jgi:hypothetical protein
VSDWPDDVDVRGLFRPAAPARPTAPVYLVGLDLGQTQDPTALVVTEVTEQDGERHYDVRSVQRLPLRTRYPAVVAHARATVAALRTGDPAPTAYLIVDATGVGRPVVDQLGDVGASALPIPVTITGGDAVTLDERGGLRVPKRDLASSVQVVLQSKRLRIARSLPMAAELTKELTGFRVKIGLSGHDSYEAGNDWRSAPHDDLVLALAMTTWFGEARLVLGRLFL